MSITSSFQHGHFSISLQLTVKVRRASLSVCFIRSLPLLPGEDVVGRDVDEERTTRLAFLSYAAGSINVDFACLSGVLVTQIRGFVRRACIPRELVVWSRGGGAYNG